MKLETIEVGILKFFKGINAVIRIQLKKHLKAYTIFDFDLDILEQKFTFKKSVKVQGRQIKGKKEWSGYYEYKVFEEKNKVELTVYLDNKKIYYLKLDSFLIIVILNS